MNREIFSHDGIHDTLTHLAAPPYFYEELKREVSRFERSQAPFSLLSITFMERPENISYEVLAVAAILKELLRAEDLAARVGTYEFAILIKADRAGALSLASRISSQWREVQNSTNAVSWSIGKGSDEPLTSELLVKLSEYENGFTALDSLNRLDREERLHFQYLK
jgi:GGDEF domain-containing protein